MRIEVSDGVALEIRRLSTLFDATEDALLRRLLKMPETRDALIPRKEVPKPQGSNGLLTREGLTLPAGTKLRRTYKGREYRARVDSGGIVVEGLNSKFTSPSLAAVAITRYPVNGWRFWEYFDEKRQMWLPLDNLRH